MVRILMFVSIVIFGVVSHADDKSSGCGLGWQVTKRNSLLSSAIRTYTNAIGSQTSAMTSGTSGCERHSIVKNEKATEHFTEANYHNLMVEMAQGQGEYVQVLGYLMGCDESKLDAFSSMTQKNYEKIFSSDQVTPAQVIENTRQQMGQDAQLAQSCHVS